MLESRYNLAGSDNLPSLTAVQSVQVLENHQPIRALDKLIPIPTTRRSVIGQNKITAPPGGRGWAWGWCPRRPRRSGPRLAVLRPDRAPRAAVPARSARPCAC
ncbi:MAG: hypothetical protein WKG07_36195 [Hymenobacter sp.]